MTSMFEVSIATTIPLTHCALLLIFKLSCKTSLFVRPLPNLALGARRVVQRLASKISCNVRILFNLYDCFFVVHGDGLESFGVFPVLAQLMSHEWGLGFAELNFFEALLTQFGTGRVQHLRFHCCRRRGAVNDIWLCGEQRQLKKLSSFDSARVLLLRL